MGDRLLRGDIAACRERFRDVSNKVRFAVCDARAMTISSHVVANIRQIINKLAPVFAFVNLVSASRF